MQEEEALSGHALVSQPPIALRAWQLVRLGDRTGVEMTDRHVRRVNPEFRASSFLTTEGI